MFSTREVLGLLAEANPAARVDEDRLRRAIRTGAVSPPSTVAGRYVWSEADLESLTKVWGLCRPATYTEQEAAHAS